MNEKQLNRAATRLAMRGTNELKALIQAAHTGELPQMLEAVDGMASVCEKLKLPEVGAGLRKLAEAARS